jgi:hypothetical protein
METVLEGEEMIKHVILLLISEVLFHLEENNMFHNLPVGITDNWAPFMEDRSAATVTIVNLLAVSH